MPQTFRHNPDKIACPGDNDEYAATIFKESKYTILIKRLLMSGAVTVAVAVVLNVLLSDKILFAVVLIGLFIIGITLFYALLNAILDQSHHTKMWEEHRDLKSYSDRYPTRIHTHQL